MGHKLIKWDCKTSALPPGEEPVGGFTARKDDIRAEEKKARTIRVFFSTLPSKTIVSLFFFPSTILYLIYIPSYIAPSMNVGENFFLGTEEIRIDSIEVIHLVMKHVYD